MSQPPGPAHSICW